MSDSPTKEQNCTCPEPVETERGRCIECGLYRDYSHLNAAQTPKAPVASKLVSMSPELADKAHELVCQLVGSFGDGISYELQHDFRQWLVDVADYAKKPPVETTREHVEAIDLLQANIHERDRRLLESNNLLRRIWVHAYSRAGLRIRDKSGHLYDDVEKKIRAIGMGRVQLEEITPEEPPEERKPMLSDLGDELIRELHRQGMVSMRAEFDGAVLRIEPYSGSDVHPRVAVKASDDHYCMCGKSQLSKSQHGYYCKGCGKDLHPDNYLPENGSPVISENKHGR